MSYESNDKKFGVSVENNCTVFFPISLCLLRRDLRGASPLVSNGCVV